MYLWGCNVVCPYVNGKLNVNWGLDDPTGKDDETLLYIIKKIEENIIALKND